MMREEHKTEVFLSSQNLCNRSYVVLTRSPYLRVRIGHDVLLLQPLHHTQIAASVQAWFGVLEDL